MDCKFPFNKNVLEFQSDTFRYIDVAKAFFSILLYLINYLNNFSHGLRSMISRKRSYGNLFKNKLISNSKFEY